MVGGARVSFTLEGFNLTNHRPVVARDQVYTDLALAPQEGASGRAALAGVVDADGNPAPARSGYGNPIAWADPLLVRLGFGVEF
jgi:hypothetical protein